MFADVVSLGLDPDYAYTKPCYKKSFVAGFKLTTLVIVHIEL